MTAIKATSEFRTILDFSRDKCSKNRIKQALRKCPVVVFEKDKNAYTMYLNKIKVGMYSIVLYLPFDSSTKWTKLKDFGDFEIKIYDNDILANDQLKIGAVNLNKDSRFKNQYWINNNFFGKLRIKHLVDIIAHCHRLDRLKAFL